NSWNLSIRIRYELLLKVLGYEFLPWSLPSLEKFLNLPSRKLEILPVMR
uniref:Uncharacterized protein n=1 Tax=Aegilops tauschii subsp. strangulata TaxID=200361 RepID=A0A453HTN5_AEGTS